MLITAAATSKVIAKRADARAADYAASIAEEMEGSNYKYCSVGAA